MTFFDYPSTPHTHKHGPSGYIDYKSYKQWLRDEFVFRCIYCLSREKWYPNGAAAFSTDHFIPQVFNPALILTYDNLIYACLRCNSWRQENDVISPFKETMSNHLIINDDGTIEGLSAEALEHIEILGLDDDVITEFRARMIKTIKQLKSLPKDKNQDSLIDWLGFPENLPNLKILRPKGNSRPDGVDNCYYNQKQKGLLPKTY